jgi:hypothetical protein
LQHNQTSSTTLRVRIVRLPGRGELDEYDLTLYRPGEVYEVPAQLASLLILSGYAQLVALRATAADRKR